ncbi:carboxymuconolactone decarboxylase family protein [Silvimonas sp. JCM 19000]
MTTPLTLSAPQLAIAPIAAFTAIGDMPALHNALEQGLDAGLSISQTKEILVQMYAYTGFPRSLNGLGELMKVLEARKQRGIHDTPGREPGPVPSGDQALAAGTANQTQLVGQPVKGPLFEFAPAIDQFLKAHLFGDIFARDNLDWPSRELVTIGALAALTGGESQLQSHVRITLQVGVSADQVRQVAHSLEQRGQTAAAQRMRDALAKTQTSSAQ